MAETQELTFQEHLILSLIPKGHENAVTSKYIAKAVGVNPRKIRSIIEKLILDGHEIGSTPHQPWGYYKIASKEDYELTERHLVSRYTKIAARVRALEKHKEKFNGQLTF